MPSKAGMSKRQGDVDLRFAQVSAPIRTLSWLGLSEREMEAATELTSSGESLESTKRLQAPGDDAAYQAPDCIGDHGRTSCCRQPATHDPRGGEVRGCHGRVRHPFQRSECVKPTAMRSDKSDPDVSSREPIGTCLATCPGL